MFYSENVKHEQQDLYILQIQKVQISKAVNGNY